MVKVVSKKKIKNLWYTQSRFVIRVAPTLTIVWFEAKQINSKPPKTREEKSLVHTSPPTLTPISYAALYHY